MKKFDYKREIKQNPFCGFMSFNHFNGEKLYSDCITDNQSNVASVETEDYECYPIPKGVEERGGEQGWYPECTIAYFRVLWKEFEPRQDEYNYQFIQDILDKAKEHNQVLAFRLMPHSTCERDDVPDWLKEIMECPKRPKGKRVKASPTDTRYLPLFSKAIKALGERFDSNPTLYSIDISLVGAWGEGEGSENYSKESLLALQDTYIKYFPNTILIGQLANSELLKYISSFRSVGWRGDGVGSPRHMNELYPMWIPKVPKDLWKSAPISFESYWWISEWYRHNWDIDKIISDTLSWHISSFNTKSFPIQYELKDKIQAWIDKMGYHFYLKQADYKINNDKLNISFNVENVGVAPIYTSVPLKIKLKNAKNEYVFITDIDIKKWWGEKEENITLSLANVEQGSYCIYIGITNNIDTTVYLASDISFDNGYYNLMDIVIQ